MSQKVLVAGTGKSGIAAAKLLLAMGGEVVLYDGNDKLDPEKIKEHGYEKTCILVVTNGDDYPDMKLHTGMDAVQGETVIAEF